MTSLPHSAPNMVIFGQRVTDLEKYVDNIAYTSYRYDFFPCQNFTDDCGWGCTIRSFQMLIGNTLLLNGVWKKDLVYYLHDNYNHPFSLHNVITKALNYNVIAGDWLAPSVTARIMKDIADSCPECPFKIVDVNVNNEEICDLPTLVLFSTRLGSSETINKQYEYLAIKAVQHPTFMGIVGGKKSSSYYFFGMDMNSNLLCYFDPHSLQKSNETYFKGETKFLQISQIHPCMTFAFFCKSRDTYIDLKKEFDELFNTGFSQTVDYNEIEISNKDGFTCIDFI